MQQIRYFVALCEEKNFSKAAKRCGVAQPSVTNAIKSLEIKLGAPLFVRQHRFIRLTPFGEQLAPYFLAIWHSAEAIKRTAQNASALDYSAVPELAFEEKSGQVI